MEAHGDIVRYRLEFAQTLMEQWRFAPRRLARQLSLAELAHLLASLESLQNRAGMVKDDAGLFSLVDQMDEFVAAWPVLVAGQAAASATRHLPLSGGGQGSAESRYRDAHLEGMKNALNRFHEQLRLVLESASNPPTVETRASDPGDPPTEVQGEARRGQ